MVEKESFQKRKPMIQLAELSKEEKEQLVKETTRAVEIGIFVIIIAILLAVVASSIALKSITVPIKKLCHMAKKIGQGDFTVSTSIETVDEIAVLTESFNDMAIKIGALVEDIKKEQAALRMTELQVLQEQINPHFLYNTLDTIV